MESNPENIKMRLFPAVGLFLSLSVFSFCLSALFLGMRRVMALGGMVASGGPYAIAHPAPGWIWIMPVSIWVGLVALFLHALCARRAGAVSFTGLSWPALFLSLGWNFFEYGFTPPGGHGPAWGWLVCGVLFALMGGVPLYVIIKDALDKMRKNGNGSASALKIKAWSIHGAAAQNVLEGMRGKTLLMVEFAAIAAGILAAIRLFKGFA
jgi:hypothetical protein